MKVLYNSVGATRGPGMFGWTGVCQEGRGGGLVCCDVLDSLSQNTVFSANYF